MKYWAYVNNEVLGPYEKDKLFEISVFNASTLICPQTPVGEKTEDWKEASTYPEVAALLNAPGASGAAAMEQTKPEPASSTTHLPKPGTIQPEVNVERAIPVFNAEMPENKLKPLSLHKLDQTPPLSTHHINDTNLEVTRLGEAKAAPKAEEPKAAQSFTSAEFDPMTLSQIGKRREVPQPEPVTPSPQPAEITAPEIFSPAPQESTPASAKADEDKPSAEDAGTPLPISENPAPAVTSSFAAEITSKLETLSRAALTKQDIEPLKERLDQMGEALASIKNSQFQREIMDKIQYLENSLSDIKASMAQAPAAASPKYASIESNSVSMMSPQPLKEAAPKKNSEPEKTVKTEIVDQGSSGKGAKLAAFVKKIFNLFLTIVLLAAVLGGAALALKHFGVFDVTKFLPFRIPYLSSPQAGTPAASSPQGFPQNGETRTENQNAGQAAPVQTEPVKKDLSPEIIYIGRTYAVEAGGNTLENMIYKDAAARKGNPGETNWQVKELPDNIFELDAIIPLTGNAGQLTYRYEVDYTRKSVKSLDDMSKKPLDDLLKKQSSSKPARSKAKRNRKAAGTVSAKQPGPAARQAAPKAAAPAEDEYEYVYEEDTTGGTEE
ncbi:MAG: hypothetical protein A2270_02975 [Elusimicrobia bacterium RIFOXYA12_FULL_51_18]|nr:MAG: hypothetical protein A2270_02975 [Elusimicrobia bacterium RIFOXYA12_FULL_51_18]OGS32150.1 MAG: hypothetical protein A2218_06960 [Elusimicrobia bacterium RIFOXYA2_FULL_53_38]